MLLFKLNYSLKTIADCVHVHVHVYVCVHCVCVYTPTIYIYNAGVCLHTPALYPIVGPSQSTKH